MIGRGVGGEDDDSVRDGHDLLHLLLAVARPKFQAASERGVPLLVEIEQKIESSEDWKMLGACEVSVHSKKATALDLVHAAAIEVRIRNQRAFAGQFFQGLKRCRRVQLIENISDVRRGGIDIGGRQLDLIGVLDLPVPYGIARIRKLIDQRVDGRLREEVVDDDMRKRIGRAIGLRILIEGSHHVRQDVHTHAYAHPSPTPL